MSSGTPLGADSLRSRLRKRFVRRILPWCLLATSPAFALTTAYVAFDHPDGWGCELAQGVWICRANSETDRKDAVILSIATIATDWDRLENYENYLKQPRTIQDERGRALTSAVSFTRRRNLNGVPWVDSLQHNSELPGFWTRYLATVHVTGQTKLAILITYIVSDEKYSKFAAQFGRMVASLRPNEGSKRYISYDWPSVDTRLRGPKLNELIRSWLKLGSGGKKNENSTPH